MAAFPKLKSPLRGFLTFFGVDYAILRRYGHCADFSASFWRGGLRFPLLLRTLRQFFPQEKIWRRGRDSNPRRFDPYRFSRPAVSTAHTPLRLIPRPPRLRASGLRPDLKRNPVRRFTRRALPSVSSSLASCASLGRCAEPPEDEIYLIQSVWHK